jgi:hypothetical protein
MLSDYSGRNLARALRLLAFIHRALDRRLDVDPRSHLYTTGLSVGSVKN